MRLGVDISTYFEELEHGAKYYKEGREVDPVALLRDNGVDAMRIRLWVDPRSEEGVPYLAGTCDFDHFLRMADFARERGFSVMLDFHYSDFWADPGKQMIPKAWCGLDLDGLVTRVYEYTRDTLRAVRAHGITLESIQIGNEITNGTLWPVARLKEEPDGSRSNYESLTRILTAASRACRETAPEAKIIIHLERSYDQAIYREYFDRMVAAGVDFDVIGFSYYPYWHGTFADLFANVDMCKRYGKELRIVELGYAFTLEDYIRNEHGGAKLVVSEDNISTFAFTEEYPISPDGQAKFTRDFLRLAEEHGVAGVYWWEPLWIPGDGICWASVAGQEYIHETGKATRNEWANQCLFDYEGKILPAFDAFRLPDGLVK